MRSLRSLGLWPAAGVAATVALLLLATAVLTEDARSLASPSSNASTASEDLTLCAPHGVGTSLCLICDPDLREPGRLWCSEHGRYEDRCWLCHPDLRDPDRLYCEEHGFYEDECPICRPAAETATEHETAARTTQEPDAVQTTEETPATQLYCNEHDLAEIECGICHPELADALEPGRSLKIRMPSAASAGRSGIESGLPVAVEAAPSVEAIGEVGYDRNRLARVTPLVEGVVRKVHVDLGDRVRAGQPLVAVASPRVAEARAELLAALAEEEATEQTLTRERELFDRGVSAERDLVDARAQHKSAEARRAALEQNLRDLGFSKKELEAIARGQSSGSTLSLVAPFAGTVVARSVVLGDVVAPGEELVRVADISRMWVTVSVAEHQLAGLSTGQRIEVRSAATGAVAEGVVTWVSSHLDAGTRMARLRAVIPNEDGRWKAGMFVDVRIDLGGPEAALAVPAGAVHRFGGEPFVFVDRGEGLFEVRRVGLAAGDAAQGERAGRALISHGLAADDRVVTAQSFLVKSEFQKSRLGAGCVD